MTDSKLNETKSPKRGRWLRRLAWAAGLLVVLLVVVYFVATSSGFVKSVILPKVGTAMNAELSAADAEVSPFRQVVFRDLKLKPNGAETLLTAKSVTARYSLWSILGGKIAVDEVTVETPTINLVQNADGSSNLDPLTKSKKTEAAKPPAPEKPSAPPNVDIKSVAIKNATIRQTKNLEGGGQELLELFNVNLTLSDIRNDFTGKMDLSAWLALKNSGTTNAGNLNATVAGNFSFSFTKDLKPASVNGKTTFSIGKTDGAFAELAALGATLDCDATPTEVKQIALRFTQSGQALGEVTVNGPFDAAKSEGKLTVAVRSIDRRVLNLAGKASGIDFGTTMVNSTSVVELSKGGSMIAAAGKLEAAKVRVTRQGQATPTLDLRCDYDVAVDTKAKSAQLKSLNLDGTQDSHPLLHGELTSPMTIAFGGASAAASDSALNLTLTGLNLADWGAFAPDLAPQGNVGAKITLLAQDGGKQLVLDLNSQIAGLSAKLGTNSISNLAAHLQGRVTSKQQGEALVGQLSLTDVTGSFGQYRFAKYAVATDFDVLKKGTQIEIRNASGELREGANGGGKFEASGNFDSSSKAGKIQLSLVNLNQDGLRPFLESMLGDKKLVSVSVNATTTASFEANGDAAVKTDLKLANLVVNDPKGSLPTTPLELRARVDTSVAKSVAQIRQCELSLTPTERAKNSLNLTGSVDFSRTNAITGNLKLAADSLDVTRYYDLFAGKPQPASTTPSPAPAPTPAPGATPADKEPDAVDLQLRNFVADVSIGRFYLREVDAADLKTTAKVDGGHVVLKPLQLTLNGAPVKTDLDLDLGVPGYCYEVMFSALGVPLAPFVNTFQPERKGQLAGQLTANAQIKGAGITGASLQKNLTGEFSVLTTNINLSIDNIRNPTLTSVINVIIGIPELLKNPTAVVGNWVGRLTGTGTGTKQDGWRDEISGAPINSILMNGTVGNGTVKLHQTGVRSTAFLADASGDITLAPVLPDSKLNIPITISLNRSLAGKIGYVNAGTPTNAAYIALPQFLTMKGELGKPDAKKDYAAIAAIAAKTGAGLVKGIGGTGGKVGGILDTAGNLFGGGKTAPPATGTNQPAATAPDPKGEGVGNLIQGLGGLFGGKKPKTTNAPAPPK